MGLEFLKRKELVAKEMLSEFSKSMISNVYNSESLKSEIEQNLETIKQLEEDNVKIEGEIKDVNSRMATGQEFRDDLLKSKYADIDQDLITLNPIQLQSDITNSQTECDRLDSQVKTVVVKEPSQYYHEDKHDEVRREINDTNIQIAQVEILIEGLEKLKSEVSGGIKCEHCGIELMNASITQVKIAELDGFIIHKGEKTKLLQELSIKEQGFTQLKKEFDEYEKNKLIKEKFELQLEAGKLKLEKHQTTYKRYQESQDKIKRNQDIDAKILKAQSRLDELINNKRELERKQTTNGNTVVTLKEKNTGNQEKIERIKMEFEKEKVYNIFTELFGKKGISKIIMKTMMPVINQELQRLLQDSCYFNLEIRINEKNNEVEFIMIDNSTGIEKLMSSGSGYERTIASMALRSVLSKICSLPKPNIIVWDEVFGKISNDNLELVGEFFAKIKDYFEKVFVITHNPLVSNWADNIVKISKVDNISSVRQ
jgi:DNA repair exonuclease SbcCD ATPase subunit